MAWVLKIYRVASILVLPQLITSTEVTTYLQSDYPDVLSCHRIRLPDKIDCICVTGLWRLYGDCSSYYSIAGKSHCLHAPKIYSEKHALQDVTHAMEILPHKETIAIVRNSSSVIKLSTKKGEKMSTRMLLERDVMVTGSPHSVKGPLGTVCLHPQDGAYCTYKPREFIGRTIEELEAGCKDDLPFIPPVSCVFEKDPQSCHEAFIVDHLEESLENEILDEQATVITKREKRQSWKSGYSGKPAKIKSTYGRTFLGLKGQILDRDVDKLTNEDEDYMSDLLLGNITMSSTDTILSEIWNYIDMQAEVVMGLRQKPDKDIDYNIPYFKLLHLSKGVMKKVCPAEYVQPGFFDVAVQTFIQVQVKRFIYEEPNANLPGFIRISNALEKCQADSETFPFLVPSMGSNFSCVPNATLGGQFQMYNSTVELNITEEFVGLDRDPIIETVWKIIFATTSFCFPYFEAERAADGSSPSFNDHHRYISWMSSLFMNGIHDVWMNSNGTNFTYDQFLGDMTVVMEKVAYCAAGSRFQDAKLIYPWEINRPGNFTPPTVAPPGGRKKRSEEDVPPVTFTSCMSQEESTKCFSKTEPFESIISSSRRKRKASVRTIPTFEEPLSNDFML